MSRDARLGWMLLAPALLVLGTLAAGPRLVTVWESLHRHEPQLHRFGADGRRS